MSESPHFPWRITDDGVTHYILYLGMTTCMTLCGRDVIRAKIQPPARPCPDCLEALAIQNLEASVK